MENSNTPPKIEVRFPNNEEIWKWWKTQSFQKEQGQQEYTMIFEIDLPKILKAFTDSFSNELVQEVIKPTKERVYTEEEMKEAVTLFAEYHCTTFINEHAQPALSYDIEEALSEIIESLNK